MNTLNEDIVIIDAAGDMRKGKLSTGSKDRIKALMLELIGDDEPEGWANMDNADRNAYRKELRKKVEDL